VNGAAMFVKRNIYLLIIVFSLNVFGTYDSKSAGLILSGVDTINTKDEYGFDFVSQKACTTFFSSAQCVNHFTFVINGFYTQYELDIPSGYSLNMQKTNLDSIKSAPQDSLFYKQTIGYCDNISVDSLSSRIGNCYIIKTGSDPRPIWSGSFFAKIKILGFHVIDSAAHEIEMRFLWAFQLSHGRDLATSGLDTFHLDTPTISKPQSQASRSINRTLNGQYVFKIVGDKFVLPQELVGKVKWVSVWDLRGRRMGKIEVRNERVIELNRFLGQIPMVFLKAEY
jgi:hypothetical protein